MGPELEGFGEKGGCVDVGIPVDLAVAEEGGALEAGDQAEHAGLLAKFQVVLEADEVVGVGAEVLLAELDAGVGPAAGLGIGEAGGLHGAEAEGVAATACGLFDREAAFEVLELFGDRWGEKLPWRSGFFALLRMIESLGGWDLVLGRCGGEGFGVAV